MSIYLFIVIITFSKRKFKCEFKEKCKQQQNLQKIEITNLKK
jgi:hypothetical protein